MEEIEEPIFGLSIRMNPVEDAYKQAIVIPTHPYILIQFTPDEDGDTIFNIVSGGGLPPEISVLSDTLNLVGELLKDVDLDEEE